VKDALLEGVELDPSPPFDLDPSQDLTEAFGELELSSSEDADGGERRRELQGRPAVGRKWLRFFLVMGTYCLVACFSIYPSLIHGPSRIIQANGNGDLSQQVWFLEFIPWAILHGHSPFITTWLNAPNGANLLGNTSIMLPSILAAPITFLFGPIAGFNFSVVLAFTLSAGAMYFAVSHLVTWKPAAYIAGLIYGFSPYMVGQGAGHIDLLFVPAPPLMLLIAYKTVCGKRQDRTMRNGILVGLLATAQFFSATEILGGLGIFAVVGGLIAIAVDRQRVMARARVIVATVGWAILTFAVICLVPVLLLLFGAQHYVGPAQVGVGLLRSDLLSVIDPTALLLIHPFTLKAPFNDLPEFGLYLGIPMLVFLALTAWRLRSKRFIKVSVLMIAVAWLLGLGPRLSIAGHPTSIPLPFAVFGHLPLFDSMIPSRLSLFVFLFTVPVVAVGLERLFETTRAKAGSIPKPSVIFGVVLAAILVPLLPAWPYGVGPLYVPSFITSPAEQSIPNGSTVVTYPFPDVPTTTPMSWQAIDHMRYKILGGEIITPNAHGDATFYGTVSDISGISYFAYAGGEKLPSITPGVVRGVRLDLRVFGVGTVIVAPMGHDPTYIRNLYQRTMNEPGHDYNGTYVWFDVQQRLASISGN
jgi:hypothetical protein